MAPGLWADQWDVHGGERVYSLRFTQAITPVTATTSRLLWRVSRNFAQDDAAAEGVLRGLFSAYYAKAKEVVETVQETIDDLGDRRDVNVSADLAALQVRKIVRVMLGEESGRAERGPAAQVSPASQASPAGTPGRASP